MGFPHCPKHKSINGGNGGHSLGLGAAKRSATKSPMDIAKAFQPLDRTYPRSTVRVDGAHFSFQAKKAPP
jgi:hypothetical protein